VRIDDEHLGRALYHRRVRRHQTDRPGAQGNRVKE
jgi:hypothetical protein